MKIGLFGVGHLGKVHLKCIKLIAGFEPIGFYDADSAIRQKVSDDLGWKAYDSAEELIHDADVIDIVTPTVTHFEIAKKAIQKGKHVFIEKPVTQTLEQATELLELRDKHQVKVQVGHVERFNPAVSSIDITTLNPMFIEVHRLSSFNPRGTDVSVVLDLMIHDIDIILHLVPSEIKSISANGVGVVSSTPDIANARIEFENGCVANLTASRISLKQMRKMRIFQEDAYVSLDFLEKNAQIIRLSDEEPEGGYLSALETKEGTRYIQAEFPEIQATNAIKQELETFLNCIMEDTRPRVPLEDGYKALKVAYSISDEIEQRLNKIKKK
ncbi:MAG: putative dehydrogenase [Maribacter sp.]|jgi:predicted dehydrogenase